MGKRLVVLFHFSTKLLSSSFFRQLFPITTWAPKYNLSMLMSDLIAGITVGFVVIPQGLAYAKIAGLPPQYGLYAAYIGVIVYTFFGTCKDITIGPTAIMSLLVGNAIKDAQTMEQKVEWVLALSVAAGGMQLIMGFLKCVLVLFLTHLPV